MSKQINSKEIIIEHIKITDVLSIDFDQKTNLVFVKGFDKNANKDIISLQFDDSDYGLCSFTISQLEEAIKKAKEHFKI